MFDSIDSIDTIKLAKKINSTLQETKKKVECLIEINTSGEPQKHGFQPQITSELISCFDFKQLKIVGLMTVGPNTDNELSKRAAFILLRELKNNINNELGFQVLKELSMGMTNDYDLAIKNGATFIRIGTGIFGKRG